MGKKKDKKDKEDSDIHYMTEAETEAFDFYGSAGEEQLKKTKEEIIRRIHSGHWFAKWLIEEIGKEHGTYLLEAYIKISKAKESKKGVEDFKAVIHDHRPTEYLLHYTSEQNWEKIQHEGLIPQENEHEKVPVIFLGIEKDEVYLHRKDWPIVIAVPFSKIDINSTEFHLDHIEYKANRRILPEAFLGDFNFAQFPDKLQKIRAYVNWLRKMEIERTKRSNIREICFRIRNIGEIDDLLRRLDWEREEYNIQDDFDKVSLFASSFKGEEDMKNPDFIAHKEEVIKRAMPFFKEYVY